MFNYETLRFVWWVLIGILLIGFAITEGFDMGVGVLLQIVGRSDIERRIIINTIAPHWDGNQVWLITAGGALFAAWPIVYSAIFSSFYIIIILMLISLLCRPIGLEFRSKIEDKYWRVICDWAIFLGSFIPPIVIGIIFGNLLQGIPFQLDDYFRLSYQGNIFQLFNPISLTIGVVILSMFITHGGTYLQIRVVGNDLKSRINSITQITVLITIVTFLLSGIMVLNNIEGFTIISSINHYAESNPLNKVVVREVGSWMANYNNYPILWINPIFSVTFLTLIVIFNRLNYNILAFISSSLTLVFIIFTVGTTLFPFIIPSNIMPNVSLTIWDSTSSLLTLKTMTVVAIIFTPIVLFYTIWCYYKMSGRITEEYLKTNKNSLY